MLYELIWNVVDEVYFVLIWMVKLIFVLYRENKKEWNLSFQFGFFYFCILIWLEYFIQKW